VFTRYRGNRTLANARNSAETAALFTVGVDGSGLKRLTPWGNRAGDAAGRPTVPRSSSRPIPATGKTHGEIYTIDADGQHLTNLTDNHRDGGSADPVWSPDGTKILFLQARPLNGGFGIGLATMNPDSTDRSFLSSDPQEEHQPDWESIP